MKSGRDEKNLRETARKVYEYMIIEHPGLSNQRSGVDVNSAFWGLNIDSWDWNPGVGVTAISSYYDQCKEPDVLKYLADWVERNKHKARKHQHVNVMAPFNIFPDMYRRTGEQKYREMAEEYGDWILKNLVRTSVGAIQHGGDLEEQIWADTIFMVVIFLARLARLTGEMSYAKEAAQQLLLHLQYLQDPETGVLFHGYDGKNKNHKSGGRWTRGNAWITVGTPMILTELKDMDVVSPEVSERYQRLVDGLLNYQADNGLWHTIMDRPTFYQESSGSAGIAGGILRSIRQGALPSSYLPAVEKAIDGLLQKTTPEGAVTDVSGGTPIMEEIEGYNKLSRYPTLYGQGLTLMLLSEYMGLLAESE
ncbi:MAG: glycoside hydrolase family 88 protein [Anaerolineae bacterium]|nr:glycoside hydrolase family 88 protein [Anaerolineae bacterium]